MPKYSLPNSTLPNSTLSDSKRPRAGSDPDGATVRLLPLLPPANPPADRPVHVLQRALKGVYSMFRRLRSSYLRSNAVRDARLDAALTGDQGYLLLHYFSSAK